MIYVDLHLARISDMAFPVLVHVLLLSLCGMNNATPSSLSPKGVSSTESRTLSCTQKTGHIHISSDTLNGYLSSQPNQYGGYGAVTDTTEAALWISFYKPHEAKTTRTGLSSRSTLLSITAQPTLCQCGFYLTRVLNLVTRCGVKTGSKTSRS